MQDRFLLGRFWYVQKYLLKYILQLVYKELKIGDQMHRIWLYLSPISS